MNSSEAGPRRRLLLAREAAKLTQTEVAEELTRLGHKTTRQAVGRWEAGKADPSMEQLCALFPLYGVTPSYIFLGRDISSEVRQALVAASRLGAPVSR